MNRKKVKNFLVFMAGGLILLAGVAVWVTGVGIFSLNGLLMILGGSSLAFWGLYLICMTYESFLERRGER